MGKFIETQVPQQRVNAVLQPISEARGLPNAYYTDEGLFQLEREEVLAKTWVCIGFASDLPEQAYVKPLDFMGLPLLLMRNRQGTVQVFHNVCSHRGMKLVQAESAVQGVVRCPYHSWTYDLNGQLKGTPHAGGVGVHKHENLNCANHGLKAIRSAQWLDMIFVNLSGDAESFEDFLAPLLERWQPFWGIDGVEQLRRVNMGGNLEIEVNCNWKLAVENYCEAYHLPWVHPSLNTYSRLEDHYNISFGEHFAGQGSLAYNLADTAGTQLPKFPAWPEDKLRHAEYVSLFPNVLLGIQADHVFAMQLEPVSAEKTVEHLRVFFVGDQATQDDYAASRTAVLESWRVVFGEDISAVEGMQQGRHSPGFNGGVFTPVLDEPTWYFHQWLARHWQESGVTEAEAE